MFRLATGPGAARFNTQVKHMSLICFRRLTSLSSCEETLGQWPLLIVNKLCYIAGVRGKWVQAYDCAAVLILQIQALLHSGVGSKWIQAYDYAALLILQIIKRVAIVIVRHASITGKVVSICLIKIPEQGGVSGKEGRV